jgi:hypothetical protein
MKIAQNMVAIGLSLTLVASSASARSRLGEIFETTHKHQPKVNAALMLSGGENSACRMGNIDDAYVVTVSTSNDQGLPMYISATGQSCVVLPISAAVGTELSITGVLQDTAAIPGSGLINETVSISEGCFNVQGFSVGLAANSASEFDPGDPANIVNAQGFSFFWYDSDNNLKPGPYKYTVVGCSGLDCPTATAYYNTDSLPGVPPTCTVLNPFPSRKMKHF